MRVESGAKLRSHDPVCRPGVQASERQQRLRVSNSLLRRWERSTELERFVEVLELVDDEDILVDEVDERSSVQYLLRVAVVRHFLDGGEKFPRETDKVGQARLPSVVRRDDAEAPVVRRIPEIFDRCDQGVIGKLTDGHRNPMLVAFDERCHARRGIDSWHGVPLYRKKKY